MVKCLIALGLCLVPAAVRPQQQDTGIAGPRAFFFLSSDEVRALRDVGPADVLVFGLKQRVEVLEGEGGPPRESEATLGLGPDYLVYRDTARRAVTIIDFALRREITFAEGASTFGNDVLFAKLDFLDMEAMNRARIRKMLDVLKAGSQGGAGHEQHLYEASMHLRTEGMAPIVATVAGAADRVSIRFRDEEIAAFRFGQETLTPAQGAMLGKALRHVFPIHPAALDAILPARRAPVELVSLHALNVKAKARTTVRFEPVGVVKATYPLPAGLTAEPVPSGNPAVSGLLASVSAIALKAIAGTHEKPRARFEDYLADAGRLHDAGDLLGSGLALLAASAHFPEKIDKCSSFFSSPAYCTPFRDRMQSALKDPGFVRLVEGAQSCERRELLRGAKAIAGVDVAGKAHGYVASMLMFCVLADLPPDKVRDIEGLGTRYPARATENALKAIQGNPHIPSYYYNIGVKFAVSFESYVAWRFFELGIALGGGQASDPFDKNLKQRQQQLLARHPDLF